MTARCSFMKSKPLLVVSLSAAAAALWAGCATSKPSTALRGSVHPESRLAELKLDLPPVSKPPVTIRNMVLAGNLAFVSGHLPRRGDNSVIAGRVGEDLDVNAGKAAARQVGLAILATLRHELGSLNRVRRVVKVLGMVNCPSGFRDQPAVINGCSELFIQVFGEDNGKGARSAVGMSSLPGNAAVEIEAIFEIQ